MPEHEEREDLELLHKIERQQAVTVAELSERAEASEGARLMRRIHRECAAGLGPACDEVVGDLAREGAGPEDVVGAAEHVERGVGVVAAGLKW